MSCAPASRRWRRRKGIRSRCTPTRSTRRWRCRPISRPASRATPSCSCSRKPAPRASSIRGAARYLRRAAHRTISPRARWRHIEEVEKLGGMAKAIEAGMPKLRIEEAAARTQARIDSGEQTVVGVNKYRPDDEAKIDMLKVDNPPVRAQQIDKLAAAQGRARRERGAGGARRADRTAQRGQRQSARRSPSRRRAPRRRSARFRCALEKVFGRHRAEITAITGVYKRGGRRMDRSFDRVQGADRRRSSRARRPPPAHPRRQDGPGRARPRAEGDRLRLRRSRLRRRYRSAVRRRPRRPRARRSRTTCTSSACRRSPPDI